MGLRIPVLDHSGPGGHRIDDDVMTSQEKDVPKPQPRAGKGFHRGPCLSTIPEPEVRIVPESPIELMKLKARHFLIHGPSAHVSVGPWEKIPDLGFGQSQLLERLSIFQSAANHARNAHPIWRLQFKDSD